MWQRYTFKDLRTIAHYLGDILVLGAAAMCAPLLVAILFHEWDAAARYLLAVGVSLSLGALMRMVRIVPGHMSRQQAIAVTGFAWIVLAMVGAIPLFLSPHYFSYSDALFDAVSAFTTTDVSIIMDLNHLSHADNMWRFVMNFSGGLGLVVVALSLGLFGNIADSSMYQSEGRSEHVLPNVVQTARFIFRFTVSFIMVAGALFALVLFLRGMDPVRSLLHGIWLAMSGFMTAGASPMSTSITYYHSVVIEMMLMVVMIFGSINFAIQGEIWAGRTESFFHDTEVRMGAVWWLIMLAVFIAAMSIPSAVYSNPLPTLMRTGMFQFVSAATTTGFVTLGTSQSAEVVPSGATFILILIMAVGGCAGSTSGGVKLQRLAIVAKSAYETVKNVASPESARVVTSYYHLGRRRLEVPETREAMTVLILFISMYLIGALAGIAYGMDTGGGAIKAIGESVAMASNSGITAGISVAGMPMGLKIVYICEMWMGRLEYIALISLAVKMFVSIKPRKRKGR